MAELLKNFKRGPLDIYRKKASFDWKKLKVALDTEEIVRYENELLNIFEHHPAFNVPDKNKSVDQDKFRLAAFRQAIAIKETPQLSLASMIEDIRRPACSVRLLVQCCPSGFIKYNVGDSLFQSSIMNMGTDRHQHFINASEQGNITGCYCLTEIGHGSNARGMRTTATYDKTKKVFVLHSPDFEAAKCWAGGLGQAATHGTVYAQLIVDGVKYGLHAFVVPFRSPNTLLPYPGVIVGDMGEKIGLNGIDNGFVQFDNYEIPRENLLNKISDVTEDGQYVTAFKDPNKRHGAALGSLSAGRVNITIMTEAYGAKALTIAIRYAAIRRQFGPDDNEVAILEYQSHQNRLIPHLAAVYVLRVFNNFMNTTFYQFSINRVLGNEGKDGPELGMEIHALSSACKPVGGWSMRDAVQECRECCAGHGYLKVSGLGDIRNDNDANLTYEGENHVLIQQTAKWLLKHWPLVLEKKSISSPLESINFLSKGLEILSRKFKARSVEEMCNTPNNLIEAYQWLVCYLLKRTWEKIDAQNRAGKSSFWTINDSQVYYAKTLAIVYIQHFFLHRMLIFISTVNDPLVKKVLSKLFSLYGVWTLEKHLQYLYQGGYAVGPQPATIIQDSVLKLCSELKDEAVALIDVIAPPDFILNSALGVSDGEVYKHLQESFFRSSYGMNRPDWWQEIFKRDIKNKL